MSEQFESISVPSMSRAAALECTAASSPESISRGILAIALYDADWRFSVDLCLGYAGHPDDLIRGNAILGIGHIARRHRRTDEVRAAAAINRALKDPSAFVRRQACAALDDITWFTDAGVMAGEAK